jgi:methyl-accepting chemotaxis protein
VKWTIGRKIFFVFAAVTLVIIAISSATYVTTALFLKSVTERNYRSTVINDAERLLSTVRSAESGQRGFIITGDESYLAPYNTAIELIKPEYADLRKEVGMDPAIFQDVNRLQTLLNSKAAELQKPIEARRGAGYEAAVERVKTGEGKQDMEEIRQIVEYLRAHEEEEIGKVNKRVNEDSLRNEWVIIGGAVAACVALFVAGVLLSRQISIPLVEMTAVSKLISSGELTGTLRNVGRSDEVGVLQDAFSRMNRMLREMATTARRIAAGDLTAEAKPQSERDELGMAFANMQGNLREVMGQTREAVNVLSSTAGEINASVSQVAAGAAETAAAISQTTATVEEVKQTAELNSDKVRQVSDNAQRASQTADEGRRSVEGVNEGMNRIRQQMDAIGTSMIRLSEQTLAVGEIIAAVNDLAEQSNILAVNASIEAAKAGEQGKGFAVVAQEMRSLAEQSKLATTQVRTLLNEIQKAASGAMLATEQGSKAVNAGMQQSDQAGHSISGLADSIARAAQAAVQIAASSQQQAVGMDQVTIAIRNIHQASVQNASAVRQVEESARTLHELGRKLKALVERYKT